MGVVPLVSRIANYLDRLADYTGRSVAWLALLLVLVTFGVVVLRYAFDIGSIALQESILYLHASIFLLGAAYTLKIDGHVRVDIFYRHLSPRAQAGSTYSVRCCCCYRFAVFSCGSAGTTPPSPGRCTKDRVKPVVCRMSICSKH